MFNRVCQFPAEVENGRYKNTKCNAHYTLHIYIQFSFKKLYFLHAYQENCVADVEIAGAMAFTLPKLPQSFIQWPNYNTSIKTRANHKHSHRKQIKQPNIGKLNNSHYKLNIHI